MTAAPTIPDHEVLRIVGRGSYGVIWLARTLTGRLRAVKVIDRATFESERTFQREFDGMSAFEPISRAHPGFVNILHVGRGDGFFYYIMELADDVERGQAIDIEAYKPRTVKSELDSRGRLPASECIEIGLKLTEALDHLHREGLIHRDIKPANLIFVKGVPKLADIGLVATSGQYSFVGTEGYVPPEGQGTPQADIFSLGKVLYEITMGKDRLDFPEMATRIDEIDEKTHVMGLNEVLLKACAGKPTRRYASAREMHDDLLRIRGGKPPVRRSPLIPAFLLLLAVAVIAAIIAFAGKSSKPTADPTPAPTPAATPTPLANGTLRIETDPPGGAVVVSQNGRILREGSAPLTIENLPPGTYAIAGTLDLAEAQSTEVVEAGDAHTVTLQFPTGNGTVKLASIPAGATVYEGNVEIGTTSATLLLEEVPPGIHRYVFRLPGYKDHEEVVKVAPGGEPVVPVVLEHSAGPAMDQPWTNSLGMSFVPVDGVLFSIWETRVKDYAAFCEATGRAAATPDFEQGDNDPVVLVNWHDAMAFCEWLTQRERAEGTLSERQSYRLPTDLEWSIAAGLGNETGETPEQRDGRFHGIFPWGEKIWPPPDFIGNYADKTLRKDFIAGYDDGHTRTAPVGSYAATKHGMQDLGGNVWEWCFDRYKGNSTSHDWGVLRGGSYANFKKPELEISYRNVVGRDTRDVIFGFRCVIATDASR